MVYYKIYNGTVVDLRIIFKYYTYYDTGSVVVDNNEKSTLSQKSKWSGNGLLSLKMILHFFAPQQIILRYCSRLWLVYSINSDPVAFFAPVLDE